MQLKTLRRVLSFIKKTKKLLNKKKLKFNIKVCNLYGVQEKISDFKNAAQAFEAGDFLTIFLRFWGF